jgi:hypothetical protein
MNIELHSADHLRNKRFWEKKPILRSVYSNFYKEIAARLDSRTPGLTVELGSGIGVSKDHFPGCITTDLFANPWVDRVENAYKLTFSDQTVRNLILFDVWHHLEYPGSALDEFSRVLVTGGRVILFEPAMSLLGRIVYGLFHREPIGLEKELHWRIPEGIKLDELGYYAAQGNCWRLFRKKIKSDKLAEWTVIESTYLPGIAYIFSGGFSGPKLLPDFLLRPVLKREGVLPYFSGLLAIRMLVVLEKR